MAKLIYCAISSLDGYIEEADGKFDWADSHEDVHAFVNDLVRPVGTAPGLARAAAQDRCDEFPRRRGSHFVIPVASESTIDSACAGALESDERS
jgi:hypothetical protein